VDYPAALVAAETVEPETLATGDSLESTATVAAIVTEAGSQPTWLG
jgi:hypothetical protein